MFVYCQIDIYIYYMHNYAYINVYMKVYILCVYVYDIVEVAQAIVFSKMFFGPFPFPQKAPWQMQDRKMMFLGNLL